MTDRPKTGPAKPIAGPVAAARHAVSRRRTRRAQLRRLVRHYANGPVDGFILAATSGEGMTLGMTELEQLVATVRSELTDSRRTMPICLGLSGAGTAKMRMRWMRPPTWPIDGYLIASPYYTRPSQRGLLQHFNALADHASWPIVLYNIPYRTAVNLTNETLLRLAEHRNIVGMKDCSADRAQSIEFLRHRPTGFRVLTGEDAQYFDALTDGADGAILLSAHLETEAFRIGAHAVAGRRPRRGARVLGKHFRTDKTAVRRAEPGAGQVLAGADRTDRQRRGSPADGGGRRRTRGAARSRDRTAHAAVVAPRLSRSRSPRSARGEANAPAAACAG